MTQERFIQLIDQPELLANISYEELKTLAFAYPYAHNLRYLLALKARQENHPEAARILQSAAAYSLDRHCLFMLVGSKQLTPQRVALAAKEEVLELKPIETVQRELEALMPLTREEKPAAGEAEFRTLPPAEVPEQAEEPLRLEWDETPADSTAESPESTEQIPTSIVEDTPGIEPPALAEVPADEASNIEPPAFAEAPADEASNIEPPALAEAPADEASNIEPPALAEAPVDEASNIEPPAFAEAPVDEASNIEPPAFAEAPADEASNIEPPAFAEAPAGKPSTVHRPPSTVQPFIQWMSQFHPPALEGKTAPAALKPQRIPDKEPVKGGIAQILAEKSVSENKEAISETLARLLVKQGHRDKAIVMYERLCLAFPEKSTYFAAEIEKLKK